MGDYLAVSEAVKAVQPKLKLLREVFVARAAAAETARKESVMLRASDLVARGNARSSGYEREKNDWYVEPRRAIDELLDVEKFGKHILDPACGGGNIPEACKARGYRTSLGTDIADRGYGKQSDFLTGWTEWRHDIIMNPPYSLATDFALHALDIGAQKIAILQRTAWLEGESRYKRLFSLNKLARIWQFRSRISMPPGGQNIEAKNGSVAFAWFVFERNHNGPPTLGWLP